MKKPHPKPLYLKIERPNQGDPVYWSNLIGGNTPPWSLPESSLNSSEFITTHRKRALDAAIDHRRFELDELDLAVAFHDLSLAIGILPTQPTKGHDSADAAGNRAGQCRREWGMASGRQAVAGEAGRDRAW
ncbi:hypothetical protein D1007_14316 [Hordeum vulgare]|nr:hypothetical protein D1007_14316 [Hordeum vulgare]